MVPFQYRALDLLADYETRFIAFGDLWRTQIVDCVNPRTQMCFAMLLDSMTTDAIAELGEDMDDQEFTDRLGNPGNDDTKAMKLLVDLGLDDAVCVLVLGYFAGRRNLIDDQRAWVRFTNLIDEEISIRAC